MRVCVIGVGYMGLVTGVCLAHIGHEVICVDNHKEKVSLIQAGQFPIFEPGLSELMQAAIAAQRIEFTIDLAAGVAHGDILVIATDTPLLPTGNNHIPHVEAIAQRIGTQLNGDYKVIVNKSTVAMGSDDRVRMRVLDGIAEHQQALASTGIGVDTTLDMVDFDVISQPESLRQGSAIYDMLNPDRIVLEGNSYRAIARIQQLYAPIISREFAENKSLPTVPVLVTDLSYIGEQILCS